MKNNTFKEYIAPTVVLVIICLVITGALAGVNSITAPIIEENSEKIFLRANADGKPEYITQTVNGVTYKAVKVADKVYIPDRTQTV